MVSKIFQKLVLIGPLFIASCVVMILTYIFQFLLNYDKHCKFQVLKSSSLVKYHFKYATNFSKYLNHNTLKMFPMVWYLQYISNKKSMKDSQSIFKAFKVLHKHVQLPHCL